MKPFSPDLLSKLQHFYYAQCDGDWEHSEGIKIDTLDNPGWSLSISLIDTYLEDKKLDYIKIERSEHDWIICYLRDGKFEGRGGPLNLSELLEVFFNWAEDNSI